MKIISNLFLVFFAVCLIISCKNAPEGEAAKTGEASEEIAQPSSDAQEYDIIAGKVYWEATKVGGAHNGSFNAPRGKLSVENGVVSSGAVMIDLNSMTETTLPDEMKTKFLNHMKSPDFFDVEKFPSGTFTIVSIEPFEDPELNYTVTGNLMLKGITKSVSFPVKIVASGDKITVASEKFLINRTDWDMKYKAAVIGTAADQIIHDDVALNIELEARAKK